MEKDKKLPGQERKKEREPEKSEVKNPFREVSPPGQEESRTEAELEQERKETLTERD